MKTLIVDTSSVVKRCLFVGKDEENGRIVTHEGRETYVNSGQFGYDNTINSMRACMKTLGIGPNRVVLVVETGRTKERRLALHPDYKAKRSGTPKEVFDEFVIARDLVCDALNRVGATVLVQENVEADDAIALLAEKIKGQKIVFSEDGDLATLLQFNDVRLYRKGMLTDQNPYGPFAPRFIPIYKAMVGDASDNYKGAPGFGEKAWMDFLANYQDMLPAMEVVLRDRRLDELAEDAEFFKPLKKVLAAKESVYLSYDLALLHPEWVNSEGAPCRIEAPITPFRTEEVRLAEWEGVEPDLTLFSEVESVCAKVKVFPEPAPTPEPAKKQPVTPNAPQNGQKKHVIFDTEIIGKDDPTFLVCAKVVETGETFSWWGQVPGDMIRLRDMLIRPDLTWVSFNGINFDAPIMSLAIFEASENEPLSLTKRNLLKAMAQSIIVDELNRFEVQKLYTYRSIHFDHIDLCEVAPGVKISLKAYAGRMFYPSMVDMPFEHDQDLTAEDMPTLERYCINDLGVTEALFNKLRSEINLRIEMGREAGLDLRSKSDAQCAEAMLRKALGIGKTNVDVPKLVRYTPPAFIQTDSEVILDLIEKIKAHEFKINFKNGSPEAPDFVKEPIALGHGTYKVGIGGLHSTHDRALFKEATQFRMISDFDVASYYPNIMISAGIIPSFDGNKELGAKFMEEYRKIVTGRVAAKRRMQEIEREMPECPEGEKLNALKAEHKRLKTLVATYKLNSNSIFGKLGSIYSTFYAPDLMLGVTLTGQLNLMCLIHDLEKISGVKVLSANTDGIMVSYGKASRDEVLEAVKSNAMRTGFEYEETPYRRIAMKDVNNYIAITEEAHAAVVKPDGEIVFSKTKGGKSKRKGLYAAPGLMKNPTMEVCNHMVAEYLTSGKLPEESINTYTDIKDFIGVRAVKGGGVQPDTEVEVDDWVLVKEVGTKDNEWARQAWLDAADEKEVKVVKRKSRPAPVMEYRGGTPFGRIARWYMTTEKLPPITYVSSGNKVPKTEGAKVCMILPSELPADLDREWYVNEAYSILKDMGVDVQPMEKA